MFHQDGTFSFHIEITALAEEFCQEWQQRQGSFQNDLEGALVLNFALCTIQHDLEQLLEQLEGQSVFGGVSPREVYERGGYGGEAPPGLSDQDVAEIVWQALQRTRRN
jgi:hypothetical protein